MKIIHLTFSLFLKLITFPLKNKIITFKSLLSMNSLFTPTENTQRRTKLQGQI